MYDFRLMSTLRKIYGICYYKGTTIFYFCPLRKIYDTVKNTIYFSQGRKIYGVFNDILYFPEGTTIFYGYINQKNIV